MAEPAPAIASQATPTAFTHRKHDADEPGEDTQFMKILGGHFVVVLVLIGLLLDAPDTSGEAAASLSDNQVWRFYMFYSHVCVMIIVGFGFLMTFLKRHNYSSISYNFMIAAFVFLWNMFAATFWENIEAGHGVDKKAVTMPLMVEGLFGAGAVLISFGAVLGKTTPSQLVIIAFWEVIFYSFNFMVGSLMMHASDAGGSMFVHTFGAYFGLALAFFLSPKGAGKVDHPYNGASYTSDMFSMIGTTFLWIYWPSFNGALAADGHQLAAVINTHISLAASVLTTFLASYLLVHARIGWQSDRKFDMVHIQNATLAGGVAMGSAANMHIAPWVCILIGGAAGLLSTVGYHSITESLRSRFNIDDTCGVHNLHGMPGVFGAVVSAIVILILDVKDQNGIIDADRTKGEQAGTQILALLVTLGIAVVGGAITAKIAQVMAPAITWPLGAFSDHAMFEVPDDYVSAGQAAMGERGVTPYASARRHCADVFDDVEAPAAAPAAAVDTAPTAAAYGGEAALDTTGIAMTTIDNEADKKPDDTAAPVPPHQD